MDIGKIRARLAEADVGVSACMCARWGALISAISPFAMTANNSVSGAISFIVLLSVGEALWSPRLYEYTVIVAPDFSEGTFMAFSHMPTFLATFISGPMSGALLQNFCPAKGSLHCETMWLIIGQRVGWLVVVVLAGC